MRPAVLISISFAVAVMAISPAQARPAHRLLAAHYGPTSPYGRHPPKGRVASDNILRVPARARGVVMLVHGGAWVFVGRRTLEVGEERWYHRHHWGTYDIDYRGGKRSFADVMAAYDHLRRLEGRGTPLCVQGESAGATMAMLLAAARPSVRCVISEAGIADLKTLPRRQRHLLNQFALPHLLWAFSPVREAARIRAPLLMAGSSTDHIVPERRQMAEMRSARPATMTMLLKGKGGSGWLTNFPHGNVTRRALHRFHAAVIRLLDHAASRRH